MTCYHPHTAYKSLKLKTERGKAIVAFKKENISSHPYQTIKLPCGQCIGCRIDKSKEWALRCVHEASLYDRNCFITLTFDDEHLDTYGTLVKSDFQKFMKRLRKDHKGHKAVERNGETTYPIRYFHCGEYGGKLGRPHHHACLFNYDFQDKELWKIRDGVRLYRSPELERLWPYGFCTIGDVTWQSAAYVARYITKKVNGEQAAEHYLRVDADTGEMWYIEPEYVTMSRRPGISQDWFKKFKNDVYPKDFVTHNGKRFQVPSYYDRLFEKHHEKQLELIKERRAENARSLASQLEHHGVRLKVKEKVLQERVKNLKRELQ